MALHVGVLLKIIGIAVAFMFINFKLVTSLMEFSLTHGEPMIKNDEKYVNFDNLRVKKVNRTHHLMIGNFTIHVSHGNEYNLFAILYRKQGNDYKKTPYKVGPNKFCDFLRDEKMFYPQIHANTDFPSIETCPWPINVYHQYGYSVQINVIPPYLTSGDYMVGVHSELNGKLQNGYRLYGTLSNSDKLQ